MPANLDDKLVVALSSRALFDFEEENAAFDEKDPVRYQKLQLERLDRLLLSNRPQLVLDLAQHHRGSPIRGQHR